MLMHAVRMLRTLPRTLQATATATPPQDLLALLHRTALRQGAKVRRARLPVAPRAAAVAAVGSAAPRRSLQSQSTAFPSLLPGCLSEVVWQALSGIPKIWGVTTIPQTRKSS